MMRLLNIRTEPPTFKFPPLHNNIPPYLILSHTWSSNKDDEVSFSDIKNGHFQKPAWHTKVRGFCNIARQKGYNYVWIDTCCIDKSSSAELAMSINSMYRWYQQADACFVYLSDVKKSKHMGWFQNPQKDCAKPKWFTRCWTLQELIAPRRLALYDKNWERLGSRAELSRAISVATDIPTSVLEGQNIRSYSLDTVVSWSKGREATWEEDRAYSLVSLLGVSMDGRYGEGWKHAFNRLKFEVKFHRPDDTSFVNFMDAYIDDMDAYIKDMEGRRLRLYPSFELENKVSDVTASVVSSSDSEDSDGSISSGTGSDIPYLLDLQVVDPQSFSTNKLRKIIRVSLGVDVSSSASKAELVDVFNRNVVSKRRIHSSRQRRKRSLKGEKQKMPQAAYPSGSVVIFCNVLFVLFIIAIVLYVNNLI
jgi:Heterokaryon incompatibility protein (HET)